MAAEPLTSLPIKWRRGDSYSIELTLPDYPSSESWTATLWFFNSLAPQGFPAASVSGHVYTWSITAAQTTTALTAGDWTLSLVLTRTSPAQTVTVQELFVTVLPNLKSTTAIAAYDARSHARIALDLIEAAIEGRIPAGLEGYTIAGRSISKIPLKDLLELRSRYRTEVAAEQAAETGGKNVKNILFAFRARN